ncbi:MAG: hypothetical protein HQM03_21615 [Magnetococcales bacterium]|nr:hypothetical protein [Magnetococcales bacterium]
MFATYNYSAGGTQQGVLDDMIAILTGESNVNNLSATCNKGATSITATITAGWTLHDAAAGTVTKVIKAPLADDASRFKYVAIIADNGGSGSLQTNVWESWDAVNHIGSNKAYGSDANNSSQRMSQTSAGKLQLSGTVYIFASARFVMLCSNVNGNWGSPTNNGPCGCFERTRFCPWDTPANGIPPFVFLNLGDITASTYGANAYATTLIDKNRNTITGSAATLNVLAGTLGTPSWVFQWLNGADQKMPDAGSGFTVPFFPLTLVNSTCMPAPFGEISALCDVWLIPQGVATPQSTIQKNGADFWCIPVMNSTKLFVARME